MVLKPCAAEKTIKGESSKLEEAIESMETSSVVLKPCASEMTAEADSRKIEEVVEPMALSSVDLKSKARKRKAEFEPGKEEVKEEEEEESDEEEEGVGDGRAKIEEEPEARIDYLKAPEWDVDSFDGLEYYSSPEPILSSSDEEFFPEEAREHYRIFKRQMIESKGFYGDSELKPTFHYKGISPMKLEQRALPNQNYRQFWQEMVYVCLQKLNQNKHSNVEFVEVVRGYYRPGPRSKSYITFMAREKPDGPLVEYQAKCMVTLDRKRHPILCRPAPTPMP